MATIGWATDIHLDHAADAERRAFYATVRDAGHTQLLVTGDIAEAPTLGRFLVELQRETGALVHFVLGNHDCYRGSIAATRQEASALARAHPALCYLPDADPIGLGADTLLIGVDGWSDGRTPDFFRSRVELTDYVAIAELMAAAVTRERLHAALVALGAAEAERLLGKLAAVPADCRALVVATHPPPFREACFHEGRISDDHWAPHFTCIATGEVLRRFSHDRPQTSITVLCGHTHGSGTFQAAPNLVVEVGAATYAYPELQRWAR